MISLKQYNPKDKQIWDNIIRESRNGTFLFYRDYMDYHSDRFEDASFIIYRKNKPVAVILGYINNKTYYSHAGLTYGGIISTSKVGIEDSILIFNILIDKLKENGIIKLVYKPVPIIYHTIPAQEDIYCLYKLGAQKIGCNLSSTIFQMEKIKFIESRKSGIRKALKNSILIYESDDYNSFWDILSENLLKQYDKKPVHSLSEISYLKSKFPENIKLFVAKINREIIAGTVLFITGKVIHTQYISANEKGKEIGALDLLFDNLINKTYIDYPIFDFGQSTEDNGNYLNNSLIFQKEGFGGRGVTYDIYELPL
jgi:hypothetical protein